MTEVVEVWRAVVGYEGLYEVSMYGRVRSIDRDVIYIGGCVHNHKGTYLNGAITIHGYVRVCLYSLHKSKKMWVVHRLVANAFLDNKEKKRVVNHLDTNKLNNSTANLEWATHEENSKHASRNNLFPRMYGEANSNSKLTDILVSDMKELYATGKYMQKDIAVKYNVSRATVCEILNNKAWINKKTTTT